MNILVVCAQFPYPPRSGFATRVYQLTRQLAQRHQVTLLSYASPQEHEAVAALAQELPVHVVHREPASVAGKRVAQALSMLSARPYSCREVYSDEMQHAISELCRGAAFDAVQLESSLLCTFAFPADVRVVLDEHNVEYEVFQRMSEGERSVPRRLFNWVEHSCFRRFEQRWWTRVDGCAVTSARECRIVSAHAKQTPVAVVPNGVDLDHFSPSPTPVERHAVVFNGILTYRPNLDAALHLVDEVWPRVLRSCPDARLRVVGRGSPADIRRLRRPGVEVLGEVPDVKPYLAAAEVVAVPVRIGGGTRLKVVEALAMGKATVSTSLGCEGVAVRDGEHLLIGDGADSFARRVLELFDDPAMAARLGRAGRSLTERAYSWSLAGERLEDLYQRLAAPVRVDDRATPAWRPLTRAGALGSSETTTTT